MKAAPKRPPPVAAGVVPVVVVEPNRPPGFAVAAMVEPPNRPPPPACCVFAFAMVVEVPKMDGVWLGWVVVAVLLLLKALPKRFVCVVG